jgi:hypothetical protein
MFIIFLSFNIPYCANNTMLPLLFEAEGGIEE